MIAATGFQRNAYKGDPPRAWIRVCFRGIDGTTLELDLLADTGNPFAVVISATQLLQMKHGEIPDSNTNFGPMLGGWLEAMIPELGFDELVDSYGCDAVVASTKMNHPDFGGLIGLPLLRMMRYGGDANFFWVEPAAATS